ncbi:hypothetical protein cand_003470 [Cryptosporidium andersoni]|uniref:Uncharacterized protein n=1 Tax=Cryptosporidium andersoni TaxID=117008 RepID=A0A1J4MKB7_9CRYT|nr:hypothetical protein cand_003470 [Cryptosporidium andersoni]
MKVPETNYLSKSNNAKIKSKKPKKRTIYPTIFRSEMDETPNTSGSSNLISSTKPSIENKNKLGLRKVTHTILQPKNIIMECNQTNLQSLWDIYIQTVLEILKITRKFSKMLHKAKITRRVFKVKYRQREMNKEIKSKNRYLGEIMGMIKYCLTEFSEQLILSDILEYCGVVKPESCLRSEINLKYLDIKLVEIQMKIEELVDQILERKKKKLFKGNKKQLVKYSDKQELMDKYYSTISVFLSCSVYLLKSRE